MNYAKAIGSYIKRLEVRSIVRITMEEIDLYFLGGYISTWFYSKKYIGCSQMNNKEFSSIKELYEYCKNEKDREV